MVKVYEHEGEKYISVNETCNYLGLVRDGQIDKVRRICNPIQLEGKSKYGGRFKFTALPVKEIPVWMEAIYSKKVTQEQKEYLLSLGG